MVTFAARPRDYLLLTISLVFACSVQVDRSRAVGINAVGLVESVYLSTEISDPVYLVQLRAEEISLSGNSVRPSGFHIPEPNETLFIICVPGSNRPSSRMTLEDLPQVGNRIRARIVASNPGTWQPSTTRWYEAMPDPTASPAQNGTDDGAPIVEVRGMTCEAIIRAGRLAFAVKSVAPSGPASEAGFQVGDILVAVGGQPINSVAALKDLADQSAPLQLSVVDVNTGQIAQVELPTVKPQASTTPPNSESSRQNAASVAERIARGLGIEVAESRIGLRKTAISVVKVHPQGAAAAAGIEVNDLIVAVDNRPIEDADALAAALPATGGKATLLIRDVRTGDDVPVEVNCQATGARPSTDDRPTNNAQPVGDADRLGLATELAFYQGEAAVRVISVQRGSPADRAGIQPGWLITAADGKLVLHPDQLKEAEENSSGPLRLQIVDPRSGRKAEFDIRR